MITRYRHAACVGLAALVLSACGPEYVVSGPLDTPECNAGAWLGRFHGNATGAVRDTLAGCAYYGFETVNEVTTFGLVLTDGNPQTAPLKLRIWIRGGRSTGAGIPVGDANGEIWGFVLVGDRAFAFTAGTIRLEAVRASDGVTVMRQGSVDLTAVESESGDSITVTGEFLAKSTAPGGAAG